MCIFVCRRFGDWLDTMHLSIRFIIHRTPRPRAPRRCLPQSWTCNSSLCGRKSLSEWRVCLPHHLVFDAPFRNTNSLHKNTITHSRAYETLGECPYLTARMGRAIIEGIQGPDPRFPDVR